MRKIMLVLLAAIMFLAVSRCLAEEDPNQWQFGYDGTDPNTISLYHLDETSGMVLNDSGPTDVNGYKGLVSPWDDSGWGVDWDPNGKFNGGLKFIGAYPSVATIPHDANQNTLSMTVEAWIKPDDGTTGYRQIVGKAWGPGDESYKYWYIGDGASGMLAGQIYLTADGGSLYFESAAGTVTAGVWTHTALTVDDVTKTAKLWVNGVEVGSADFIGYELQMVDKDIFIGGHTWDGRYWLGMIDEIRLSKVARWAQEPPVCTAFPTGDLSGPAGEPDCYVDMYDFAAFASAWLSCTATLDPNCTP